MSTKIIDGAKVTAKVFAIVTANLTLVAMLVYPALVAGGYTV